MVPEFLISEDFKMKIIYSSVNRTQIGTIFLANHVA
jgi:hypothetical protein